MGEYCSKNNFPFEERMVILGQSFATVVTAHLCSTYSSLVVLPSPQSLLMAVFTLLETTFPIMQPRLMRIYYCLCMSGQAASKCQGLDSLSWGCTHKGGSRVAPLDLQGKRAILTPKTMAPVEQSHIIQQERTFYHPKR